MTAGTFSSHRYCELACRPALRRVLVTLFYAVRRRSRLRVIWCIIVRRAWTNGGGHFSMISLQVLCGLAIVIHLSRPKDSSKESGEYLREDQG